MKWSITWALALVVVGATALHAAPPRSKGGKAQSANAKTMDLMKAITDKQVNAQITVQNPTSALLTLTNTSQEPLNIKVPLALAARPQVPEGANQAYFAATFGTPSAPQSIAVAVSPLGAAGVEKKSRKTGAKGKKKGDEAKEEKKDDAKDGEKSDEKKETDSLEASVLLLPSISQSLPLFTFSLDNKKLHAAYGPFAVSDLDKVSESSEMKSLLEKVGQGMVPRNVAQILAWHYHNRLSWDEMANSGLGTPADLQVAQKYAEVVEGKTPATPVATTGKRKKRAASSE